MDALLPALLIFSLRILDVSIGTVRMLYAMRGRKYLATSLGLLESGVFIFAISSALKDAGDNPLKMVGYAAGFATGTFIGMSLEGWIASGSILARIISRDHSDLLATTLRENGFGLTVIAGEGHASEVHLLFVVAQRRRGKQLAELVAEIDPDAFMTVDTVNLARGGYLPHMATPSTFRK